MDHDRDPPSRSRALTALARPARRRSRRCAPSWAGRPRSRSPSRPGRCSSPPSPARHRRAGRSLVAVPTAAEAERIAHDLVQFLGSADRVELFPAWETLPFERVSPVARDDGPAAAGDVAAARGAATQPAGRPRRAGPGARAAARPARRGRRADPRRARRPGRPRRARRAARRRRATGASTRSRRGARSRCAARSSTSTRRPPTIPSASTCGATRSTGSRRSRSPTSARPTTSTRRGSSRPASCCRPTRCASRAAALVGAGSRGAREQWERLAEGQVFDGMESWLPWLTEREHLLPDLLPDGRARAARRAPPDARPGPGAARRGGLAGRDARRHLGRADGRDAARACRCRSTGSSRTPTPASTTVLGDARLARHAAPRRHRRSTRSSATPRALVRPARAACRATATGSCSRPTAPARPSASRDVLAGDGIVADHGADRARRRSRSSSRRSSAASSCPAPSSRSSPRPTSPAAGGCTAAPRGARARRRLLRRPRARRLRRAPPPRRRPLRGHGRRAPSAASSATTCCSSTRAATSSTCRPTRSARSAATPAATRRRCTAWAAPTGEKARARVRSAVQEIAQELVVALPPPARDPRARVPARHAVAARDGGGVPVRGDARPAARRSTR